MSDAPDVGGLVPSADVLVAHLAGEAVLLDVTTKRYFQLNATGAVIWRGLEGDESAATILDRLVAAFDVSEAEARAELERFVASLVEARLLVPRVDGPRG